MRNERKQLSDLRDRVLSDGTTNVAGQFTLFLAPGRYLLRISHPGFQDQSLTVDIGRSNQAIAVAMRLKTQRYSVTVSDAAGPLDTATESHQDSLKLGPEDLENLPMRDGDVLSALSFFTNPAYLRNDTSDVFGPPPPGGLPPGVSGKSMFALPADNYNLRPEWGPSTNDIRHQLGVSGTLQLSWRLSFGTLASVHSGLPYDITTGYDNNHDTDPNDRPAGITRNTGRGAGFFSLDVHLARSFVFQVESRKVEIEFAADSFNALNHTNPSNYVGVESSPLFGQPNAAYNGRELQFSIHVHF